MTFSKTKYSTELYFGHISNHVSLFVCVIFSQKLQPQK